MTRRSRRRARSGERPLAGRPNGATSSSGGAGWFAFIMAINEYKQVNSRPFPTWTEVLDVIQALGYRKVAERQDIH